MRPQGVLGRVYAVGLGIAKLAMARSARSVAALSLRFGAARGICSSAAPLLRQHVNTLAAVFADPPTVEWESLFGTRARLGTDASSRPLHLELGCSGGVVLENLAKRCPDWDFLGFEVRDPVVKAALQLLQTSGVAGANAGVLRCNPQLTGEEVLQSLCDFTGTEAPLVSVTVQHPDPCFKTRHSRRRVLTPRVLSTLARRMPGGAALYLQTDVPDVMRSMLDACAHPLLAGRLELAGLATTCYERSPHQVSPPGLAPVGDEDTAAVLDGWLGARSPREEAVKAAGGVICRAALVRRAGDVLAADAELDEDERSGEFRFVWDGTVPCVPLARADALEPASAFPWRLPATAAIAGADLATALPRPA